MQNKVWHSFISRLWPDPRARAHTHKLRHTKKKKHRQAKTNIKLCKNGQQNGEPAHKKMNQNKYAFNLCAEQVRHQIRAVRTEQHSRPTRNLNGANACNRGRCLRAIFSFSHGAAPHRDHHRSVRFAVMTREPRLLRRFDRFPLQHMLTLSPATPNCQFISSNVPNEKRPIECARIDGAQQQQTSDQKRGR